MRSPAVRPWGNPVWRGLCEAFRCARRCAAASRARHVRAPQPVKRLAAHAAARGTRENLAARASCSTVTHPATMAPGHVRRARRRPS